jgi:hypothetical protein
MDFSHSSWLHSQSPREALGPSFVSSHVSCTVFFLW